MIARPHLLRVLTLPALLLAAAVSADQELYRYYDDDGNLVVDYQVPTDHVAKGYEVLNESGIVIRVVPKALSEEEKVLRDVEEKREQEALLEAERLREWDENLLLRYSTIADIEAARERGLRDLRIRVSILKSNKRSLKLQVENYQAQAADLERRGQKVDVARLTAIEDLQGDIATTDRAIDERNQEIEALSEAYAQDIARFEMLLDMVELRRTLLMAQDRDTSR
jgi:hypothetical protein